MENKKLLKYLLKDLSELEEMFTESGKNSFDELEKEFIQNRVTGAKKLVQLFLEQENMIQVEIKPETSTQQKPVLQQIDFSGGKTGVWVEEANNEIKSAEKTKEITEKVNTPGVVVHESIPEVKAGVEETEMVIEKEVPQVAEVVTDKSEIDEKLLVAENQVTEPEIIKASENNIQEQQLEEVPKQTKMRPTVIQQELQLEEEQPVNSQNKRLSDLFAKEKSVNDLLSDSSKLDSKLSNRPVENLQAAIGINDRFQYIRELFEGSADNFVKTVAELDSMEDMKDAVDYLQTNFKWKKNETSLKFVNLIKRRFSHE